jgi:hypothetical protein
MVAIARRARKQAPPRKADLREAEGSGGRSAGGSKRPVLRAGLVAVALSSCAIVEITDPEGRTSIERRFGFTSIAVEPEREAVVASLRSFGLASTPLGFTAGYAAHQLAVLGEDCRVVLWVESEQQRLAVEQLAATLKEICIVSPD